jgi:hypothetical protein
MYFVNELMSQVIVTVMAHTSKNAMPVSIHIRIHFIIIESQSQLAKRRTTGTLITNSLKSFHHSMI